MTRKAFLVSTSAVLMIMMGSMMRTRCSSVEELDVQGSGRLCEAYRSSKVMYCVHMTAMTWIEAVLHCASLGGSLSDVLTEQDQNFQKDLARRAGARLAFWVSGSNIESNSDTLPPVFKWLPARGSVNKTLFAPSEPSGKGRENCLCVTLLVQGPFNLGDWHCWKKIAFMCKFKSE